MSLAGMAVLAGLALAGVSLLAGDLGKSVADGSIVMRVVGCVAGVLLLVGGLVGKLLF